MPINYKYNRPDIDNSAVKISQLDNEEITKEDEILIAVALRPKDAINYVSRSVTVNDILKNADLSDLNKEQDEKISEIKEVLTDSIKLWENYQGE